MLWLLLYAALFVFFVGMAYRLIVTLKIPQPFNVPTMPAPRTRAGVVGRLLKELVLFDSLFKASVWTWFFAWLFHAGLFFTLLVHLRYLSSPTWSWVAVLIPFNPYASAAMAIGLVGLFVRRCCVDRVRAISAPSDYLMLLLILAIPITGMAMRLFTETDFAAVTAFARGIVSFSPQTLSAHVVLFLHVVLVCVLLFIFPFSKLVHASGVLLSPARNQRDNSRTEPKFKSKGHGKFNG